LQRLLGIERKRRAVAHDRTIQHEPASGLTVIRECVDRHLRRPAIRHEVGHDASSRDDDDARRSDRLGERGSGGCNVLLVVRRHELTLEPEPRVALAGARDCVDLLHTAHGVFSDARFARQHHGVYAFVDRVRDVGDFRPRGRGRIDHRLQ
jgi:hypothetical protein